MLKTIGAIIVLAAVSGSASASGETELWRLDLATGSGIVGPDAFSAWMDRNGFQSFQYLFFKRRPEYWRIGACEGIPQSCLVLQEKASSSHIIYPFEPPLAVEDSLMVELAYLVKLQPEGAQLDQKGKEDAPLRVFLSFQTEDGLLHLALTDSAAHAAGSVIRSEREPDTVRYYVLPDRSVAEGYRLSAFPVRNIFQKVFGPIDPGELVAIGIKSDSNNLGGESLTFLRTLRLIR